MCKACVSRMCIKQSQTGDLADTTFHRFQVKSAQIPSHPKRKRPIPKRPTCKNGPYENGPGAKTAHTKMAQKQSRPIHIINIYFIKIIFTYDISIYIMLHIHPSLYI